MGAQLLLYILKRVLVMVPTLFAIALVCFVVLNLAPGRPGAPGEAAEAAGSEEARAQYRIFKETFNYDKPVLFNTMFLVEREGLVLLILRRTRPGRGLWSIPAGFVEYDEDPALTAIRECHEETGLEVEITGLLDLIPGEGLPGEASFIVIYRARVVGGALKPGDDAAQAAFFTPDDLPPLAFSSTQRALNQWQKSDPLIG